ncbi:MAG: RluA family pseudouridine synthase [Christensenellaceae bacterium]|nr:RluA family pseudouridine synthase [Christensenellaceae bacterium]
MEKRTIVAGEGAGRLDKYLSEVCPEFSRSFFQNLIAEGQVFLNDRPAQAKDKPKAGSTITFCVQPPKEIDALPEDIPIDIVYEDEDMVVVNKAKGMVVHPAPGSESGTLVNALLYHVKDLSGINGALRPGIVHRLDKDTTGLLVVAKNDAAHQNLAAQIQAKTAGRIYKALVFGGFREDEGTVRTQIGRSPSDRKKMAVVRSGGREAVTHWRVMERYSGFTLVEARLETGRTHQIRVHMAHLGHPVAGDETYTKLKAPFASEGQMLHAGRLTLCHPRTGQAMEFTAPLPDIFTSAIEKLKKKSGL